MKAKEIIEKLQEYSKENLEVEVLINDHGSYLVLKNILVSVNNGNIILVPSEEKN